MLLENHVKEGLPVPNFMLISPHSICRSGIEGCMFGQFRTINNHIHCILQKPKPQDTKTNRRYSLKKKKPLISPYEFEVPDQNYHMVSRFCK